MNLNFFDIFVRPSAFVQWSEGAREPIAARSPPDDPWITCRVPEVTYPPGCEFHWVRTQVQQKAYFSHDAC